MFRTVRVAREVAAVVEDEGGGGGREDRRHERDVGLPHVGELMPLPRVRIDEQTRPRAVGESSAYHGSKDPDTDEHDRPGHGRHHGGADAELLDAIADPLGRQAGVALRARREQRRTRAGTALRSSSRGRAPRSPGMSVPIAASFSSPALKLRSRRSVGLRGPVGDHRRRVRTGSAVAYTGPTEVGALVEPTRLWVQQTSTAVGRRKKRREWAVQVRPEGRLPQDRIDGTAQTGGFPCHA